MDLEIGTLNCLVSDPRWFLDYRVETLHIEYSEEDIYLLKLGVKVVPIENIKALVTSSPTSLGGGFLLQNEQSVLVR